MPSPPLARARLAPTRVALAIALCALLALAAAAPAVASVTRKQAASKALAALGSRKGTKPVIVFGLTSSVANGARITQGGAFGGAAVVGSFAHQRAFLFYEDSGPYRAYPHAGRVALVGANSGRVKLSRTLSGAPLVNGKLPAFLKSAQNYRAAKYRVFARGTAKSGGAGGGLGLQFNDGDPATSPGQSNSPPRADKQDVRVKKNAPKHITLTGSDDDGDLLIFEITKQPDHGTLSGQAPDVVYTPDPNYLGADDFSFKTSDGPAESNTAKVSIVVVDTGAPPVVTTSAGCTDYTEQRPAVAIDGGLTVADPDDTTLDSASVLVVSNAEDGDELLFTDQNGISSSYDAASGLLHLTGTASVANYQTALRTVRYRNLSNPNPSATKDVRFQVNDGGNDSAPVTKQLCISGGDTAANDKPILDMSEDGSLQYTENDGPVPVDAGLGVLDPDSADLSGATVKFAATQAPIDEELGGSIGPPVFNFFPAEDDLAFTDQNGISGSYDDVTGVLTLTGTASVANYTAALRSVTYENSSEDPSDAPRTVRFQVTDTTGASSTARTRAIFVTPVNDAPTVATTSDAASYVGTGPAVTIDGAVTAGDVDDDDLEGAQVKIAAGFESGDDLVFADQNGISGDYDDSTGVLTLTGTASVADYEAALRSVKFGHTPGNAAGSRSVEYTVNDGDLDSSAATRAIDVNDQPVVTTSTGNLSYTENDGPVAVDPGVDVSDADSASLAGATVRISSNLGQAEDALAVADQNGISGSYDALSGTLTLSGSASVADYEAALRSVTYENSSDDPSPATRTVTFQVDDGATNHNLSDTATRDVDVTAVNDAPAVTTSDGASSYTVGDTTGQAVDPALTVTDADDTSLESAEVRIASGHQSGDELAFSDQNGITGSYDDTSGALTLSGSASVGDYETALRSVAFRTSAEVPGLSRTVEFTVNDGDADSNVASRSVAITAPPASAPPVVTTSDGATNYTVGDTSGQPVDAALTVADADDTELESAQVRVATGFESNADNLVYVDQNGIAGVYNTGTGVLTLTGTATVAEYEAALRSIKFTYSGENPSGSRTVEFTVNDGDSDSEVASKAVELLSEAQ